jgi:fructokinase
MALDDTQVTQRWPLIVGLGEALFDCFPDRTVLGGAPINVAVHAAALMVKGGGGGVPATRVGRDDLGDRFHRELTDRGVPTNYVQRDPRRPTGQVTVSLDSQGNATYRFQPHSAWDAICFNDQLKNLANRCHAVTFGTLAQRERSSRDAIAAFLQAAPQAVRLFDVNLRQNFYSMEVIETSLRLASALKLNNAELDVVSTLLDRSDRSGSSTDKRAHSLCHTFRLDWLALTRGAHGTIVYADGVRYEGPPVTANPTPNADSVGAGDACSAGLLCGTLLEWPIPKTLDLANMMGAYVASQPGATPQLPGEILAKIPTSGEIAPPSCTEGQLE